MPALYYTVVASYAFLLVQNKVYGVEDGRYAFTDPFGVRALSEKAGNLRNKEPCQVKDLVLCQAIYSLMLLLE